MRANLLLIALSIGLASSAPTLSPEPTFPPTIYPINGRKVEYTLVLGAGHGIAGTRLLNGRMNLAAELKIAVTFHSTSELMILSSNVSNSLYDKAKENPIYFRYENGIIPEIFASPDDPEAIVNFKRGIISAFQVRLLGQTGRRKELETDVLGECESTIMESAVGNEWIVLRNRETENCLGRPSFTSLTPSKIQEAKTVYGIVNCEHVIAETPHGYYVKTASLVQTEHFAPMTKTAGDVATHVTMELTALTEPTAATSTVPSSYIKKSLKFSYFFEVQQNCSCTDVAKILEELDTCPSFTVPERFSQLLCDLRQCMQSELQVLFDKYSPTSVGRRRSFFMDSLAFVATEPALSVISDAIQNPKHGLSNSRQRELINSITFIPFHYVSPCVVLSKTLEMAKKTPIWQTSTLTLGSVINSVTYSSKDYCNREIEEAISWLEEKLHKWIAEVPSDYTFWKEPSKKDKRSWENAIHAIKGLGNAGVPSSLPALQAAWNEKKLLAVGRSAAVYAMKRIAKQYPSKVAELCRNIIRNVKEDDEVRLAAFSVFMTTVDVDVPLSMPMLLSVMDQVAKEPVLTVKSYMCRYLTQIRKSTEPRLLYRKMYASSAMKISGAFVSCAVTKFKCFSSAYLRTYMSFADLPLPRRLPRDVMGAGGRLSYYAPDRLAIPHSVYAKIFGNALGYDLDLIEIGVRGTGVNRLIDQLFGPVGYFRLLTRNNKISGLKRQEDLSFDLKALTENMTFSGFVRLLGNELSWNHNEQPNLLRLMYAHPSLTPLRHRLSDILMYEKFTFWQLPSLVRSWKLDDLPKVEWPKIWNYLTKGVYNIDGGKMNITKTGSFLDVKRMIPTISGFPLNMTASAIGHFNMDAEATMDYHSEGWKLWGQAKRDRFEMSGEINASVDVTTTVEIVLDAYYTKPKVVHNATFNISFSQSGVAVVHDNYTCNLQLHKMPKDDSVLMNATSMLYADTDGHREEMGIEKRKTTNVVDPFGEDFLGIMTITNISFPYYKGMNGSNPLEGTPWFPLSGSANLSLTLRKTEPGLTMLNFTAYNSTSFLSSHGVYNSTWEAVGTPLRVTTDIIWDWLEGKRAVYVNTTSKPGWWRVEINATDFSNQKLKREVWINSTLKTDYHYNNMTVHVRGYDFDGAFKRREHTRQEMHGLIKSPADFTLIANGSISLDDYGNVSLHLYNKENCLTHYLVMNSTSNMTHSNVTVNSTLFKSFNLTYCRVPEIKRAFCHVYGNHFVTFDGLKYSAQLNPKVEYVLTRHRHPNDTFAITIRGTETIVYLNGTSYTLKLDGTQLLVNGEELPLPYKVYRTMNIRKVEDNEQIYVRLSAFAGVDVIFSENDVLLSISRFFRNQTAGLCGNSNVNKTEADELELPNYSITKSIEEFVSKWSVPSEETADITELYIPYPCPKVDDVSGDTIKMCTDLFFEAMEKCHTSVEVTPYFGACLCNVSNHQSYVPSVRAYAKACHAKGVSTDGCLYGPYENSGVCQGSKQKQTRSVLLNPLKNACKDTTRTIPCKVGLNPHPLCPVEKVHHFQQHKSKICRSDRRHPSCGRCCEPVAQGEGDLAEYRCIKNDEPVENFRNAAPIQLLHLPVVSCKPKADYFNCMFNV